MHWESIVIVIALRTAYDFYRSPKKHVHRFISEFEEVIKIIEDTPGTFIHYPQRISNHHYEVNFDVKLYTGKAKGRASLNLNEKDLIMQISYQIPVPEKYMMPCYEFIGNINDIINISKWELRLDHRTRLITFVFGLDFEPGIGVLPPYSEHILNYAIAHLNQYLKGIQKITLCGMTSEEEVHYCVSSNVISS
jgi:hypothetical protein